MVIKNRYKLNPKRKLEKVRINRLDVFPDSILSGKEWEQFTVNNNNVEPILVHCTVKDLVKKKKAVDKEVGEKSVIEPSIKKHEDVIGKEEKEDLVKSRLRSDRNDMVDIFSKLPGIGKVSAAKIYDSGICTLMDMVKADPENISKIVGRFFTTEKAEIVINGAKDLLPDSYNLQEQGS